MDLSRLKRVLENLYRTFDYKEMVLRDPIEFPRRYVDEKDIEVSGFIASALAYGKVTLFKPVISRILRRMGDNPAEYLLNFDIERDSKHFTGIKYRFNKDQDILCLIYTLSEILKKWGSIESCFLEFYDGYSIKSGLTGLVTNFLVTDKSPIYGKNNTTPGFRQFFPSPETGTPCKRLNLFLRWMIRKKDVDLGIWDSVPVNQLIIPLDTHIARISLCLGLTRRKTRDWKMAEEITASLKMLDSDDPVKYDFALCHQGILGYCNVDTCGENFLSCTVMSNQLKEVI